MKYFVIGAIMLFAKAGFCLEGWFTIPLSTYSALTINAQNASIGLQAPDGLARPIVTGDNPVNSLAQINITAPVGREKEWEAMILTAIASGSDIRVFGDYSGTTISCPKDPKDPTSKTFLTLIPAGK